MLEAGKEALIAPIETYKICCRLSLYSGQIA